MEDYEIEEFDAIELYKKMYSLIKPKEYPLQLDLVINRFRFKGFKYSFKEKETIYYVNAEFENEIPAFLGVKDTNGYIEYMDDKDFDMLKERVMNIDFSKLENIFDQEMIDFVKKIPEVSKETTKRFKKLLDEDNLSIETYYDPIKEEISELSSICKKHPFIPLVSEENINGEYIQTFHY